jgi:hypothetical protein
MKSNLVKLSLLGIIWFSFSLQAFTPPLPPATTICVDQIPSCYQIRVTLGAGDQLTVLQPRTRDWFLMQTVCSWDGGSHNYQITVETKATSTSNWVYRGSIGSASAYATNHVDDFLYFIEIHMDQLIPPPVPE